MDFTNHIVPEYAYRSFYSPLHQEDELWDRSPVFRGHQINRVSANGSPTQPAMDRYLQERDRPSTWFTTRMNDPPPPFPGLEHEQTPYPEYYGHPHYPYRYPSPTESGLSSSSYGSSGHNDHHSTPWSSPDPCAAPHSPDAVYLDHHGSGYGFRYRRDELESGVSRPCVTMHEVQGYPDAQPDAIPHFDNEDHFYASLPQEGFEPMEQEVDPGHGHPITNGVNGIVNGTGATHRDASSPEAPNIRRRRPQSTHSPASPTKVSKRHSSSRRTSSFSKTNGHKNSSYCQSASNRAFPCPFAIYSCTSTFGAKNEWKRHVNTQHMQTGFWRCDQCDQNERKPNDFNRKDLFIQHVRRMHPLETEKATKNKPTSRSAKNDPEDREMNAIAVRCFMPIREPPAECECLICDAKFTGSNAWDERLEHIGKHWEATKKDNEEPNDPKEWREDRALHHFLDDQGIIAAEGKRWILA